MTEAQDVKGKSALKNSLENALRRKRKLAESGDGDSKPSSSSSPNDSSGKEVVVVDEVNAEEKLRKKAAETLLREAQRSKERASRMGPQGWLKPRPLNTNKNFLTRTLQSVELSRRYDHPESKKKKHSK